ncbi:MAG: hypothetical protein PHH49_08630, partial [Candidatus Omnitrophica bacterium]|nr:hypothetical protein [Candidatus Omnitrophota bacterium]
MKTYYDQVSGFFGRSRKTKPSEQLLFYEDDIGAVVSIIDARRNRTKKIFMKSVASLVSFVFLWQQIASAWGYPQIAPSAAKKSDAVTIAPQQLDPLKDMVGKRSAEDKTPAEYADKTPVEYTDKTPEGLEITNYDLLAYKRRTSGVVDLLSSKTEQEQDAVYAPDYLRRQQNKHEEIIRQKQDTEDLILQLRKKPREEVEDMPLKKKKGSGGGDVDYTLTDPDEYTDPHTLNDFNQNNNQDMTVKYDITKIDIERWMQNAEERVDEETGLTYWVGSGDPEVGEDRTIQIVMYFGEGDDKKVQTIFVGFRATEDGAFEAKYRVDYVYENGELSSTKKYDISGEEDLLVEMSLFEGEGDNSHVVKTLYYDPDGSIKQRRDYAYSEEGALEETRLFDSDSEEEGEGELIQRTVFTGEKDKELADYSQTYKNGSVDGDGNISGEVLTTTVYYYHDGNRADDVTGDDYRYSKTKQVTFRGDPDTNGDGELSEEELAAASIKTTTYFDADGRLAGEEVVDHTTTHREDGSVASTTVYYYDGERASEARYVTCMSQTVTYAGDLDTDGDGVISEEELAAGVKVSETFYDVEGRLKGEEKAECTIKYDSRGEKTSMTVYMYEGTDGLVGADDAEADAAMRKSTVYSASSIAEDEFNEDGTLKEGEDGLVDDPVKISETIYCGDVGEEKADYTVKYNSRGDITSITVYMYEGADGLVGADEAGAESAMKKSTVYSASSIAADEFNEDGTLKEGEDGLVDDPLKISETFYYGSVGSEKAGYMLKYDSRGEITSITVYMYQGADGLVGADEADADAEMKRSTVYSASSIAADEFNEDGTLKEGEDGLVDDPLKISDTFYEGAVGEEKADFTVKYNSLGEKTSLTVYLYESASGLVGADDAISSDPLKKTVVYSSSSIAEDEFNEDGTL